jgi:hypothetical protein
MERPPLMLAEVLDEELLFLDQRRAARTGERTLPRSYEWEFHCDDFREIAVLEECLERKEVPPRYELLRTTPGKDRCAQFNALANDTGLLEKLLKDPTFVDKLFRRKDVIRRLLDVEALRRTLIEKAFARLKTREMLRATVAGGDEVADLLEYPDVGDAVGERPQLLGSIMASPELRTTLAKKHCRSRLAQLAEVPQKTGVFRKIGNAIEHGARWLFRMKPKEESVPERRELDFGDPSQVLHAMHRRGKEVDHVAL